MATVHKSSASCTIPPADNIPLKIGLRFIYTFLVKLTAGLQTRGARVNGA